MKRTIELSIEMELTKIQNLRKNIQNLETKLLALQQEREKIEKSIELAKNRVVQIGLKNLSMENSGLSPEQTAEELSKRKEYNQSLQAEKGSMISSKYPEAAKEFRNPDGGTSSTDLEYLASLIG